MKIILKLLILTVLCASCVQEVHLKTVTFKVDMNGVDSVSQVGVRGQFTDNPWTETFLLTDENNDGIYEGTYAEKTAANQVQFKFVNQNSDYELKDTDNRVIQFEYQPETIIYEAVFNDVKGKQTTKK